MMTGLAVIVLDTAELEEWEGVGTAIWAHRLHDGG